MALRHPARLSKQDSRGLTALLGVLWMWTLAGIGSTSVRIVLSLTLAMGLGIALEWYQTTVPGRYGSIADVLLNSLGVALGIVAALFLL